MTRVHIRCRLRLLHCPFLPPARQQPHRLAIAGADDAAGDGAIEDVRFPSASATAGATAPLFGTPAGEDDDDAGARLRFVGSDASEEMQVGGLPAGAKAKGGEGLEAREGKKGG